MEVLLSEPHTLTPRLLFELYVHKENLTRTLAQTAFSNMQEGAQAKLRKQKQRDEGAPTGSTPKSYTLKTSFTTIHDRDIDNFRFREFIEILNMLDEQLLGCNSNKKKRRRWNDVTRLSRPIHDVEDNKILLNELEPEGDPAKLKLSKKYLATHEEDVIRELTMWAILGGRDDKIEQIVNSQAQPLKNYVFVSVVCKKCAELCKLYRLNGLVGKYYDLSETYEKKSMELISAVRRENSELSLLMIRRRLPLLGRRTILDLANFGKLEELMASGPIQELVTKMWYGGLEPEGRWGPLIASWILPPLAPLMLPPANDVHVDFEASIFSWVTLEPDEDSPIHPAPQLSYVTKILIFLTAPYTAYFYNFFVYLVFLAFFAYVIMRRFCLRPAWQEYLVVVTLVAICLERLRNFAAMRALTKKQKLLGLAKDGWNIIYMISFFIMLFGVIFRFIAYIYADSDMKAKLYGDDAEAVRDLDICPPMVIGAKFYTTEPLYIGSFVFELDLFVKWAHICYCVSFFLMFCGVLHFYNVNKMLGPLGISLGYMVKDFYNFIFLLLIFMIPYGVLMQSLLYPNEIRIDKTFNQLWFKPYMSLFGEMFKSETATYVFDSVSDCHSSDNMIYVPSNEHVFNPENVIYVYQTTDKGSTRIKSTNEYHILNGMAWYRPNHWIAEQIKESRSCNITEWNTADSEFAKCNNVAIVGLMEIKKVRDKLKAFNVDITYSEALSIGMPYDKPCSETNDVHCDGTNIITNDEIEKGTKPGLFVPIGDKTVFNPSFVRCPERYWFNSIILITYMMFAVIMLVNLLVAMFATTYSNVQEKAELIWKQQRYQLVMDYYNNPAKPITPPLILIFDIYWIVKKIILTFVMKSANTNQEILHPRVLGQHPLRLPPSYVPEEMYDELFAEISSLEKQINADLKEEDKSKMDDVVEQVKKLRFKVKTLNKALEMTSARRQ